MVILKYPNVLINPHKTLLNTIAPERSADIPTIIVQKPWLYTLYKVVRYCCDDYGYGSYETVLKFLQYIEALFGKIEQVYFKQMAPLANGGERRKKTIPYTVLLIERKDSRGSYYFVSLGSGYGTAHSSSRSRMMKMLFNEVFFEEFIVETPPKETDAYSKMLLDVFNMCSTGNNSYDIFELQDGTAVVVKEPEGALRNTHCICDGVSCGFKTIQILPLEQAREEKKEWIEKIEQELDELDEFGDECTEDFFEDMYVDDDEID